MSIILGLGSNVGDRLQNLQSAVDKLSKIGEIIKVSKVYETEPWGKTDQPAFLNACVKIECNLNPEDLLNKLKQIEKKIGRVERERWGPREIDIDILFYDDIVIESQRLTIPHPLLHERAFVLVPLNDIAPEFTHPKLNVVVSELLKKVDRIGVRLHEGAINLK